MNKIQICICGHNKYQHNDKWSEWIGMTKEKRIAMKLTDCKIELCRCEKFIENEQSRNTKGRKT